jgi:hypothetical protein
MLARRPKHRTDALGGAVWAVAAQPAAEEGTQIAARSIVVNCLGGGGRGKSKSAQGWDEEEYGTVA